MSVFGSLLWAVAPATVKTNNPIPNIACEIGFNRLRQIAPILKVREIPGLMTRALDGSAELDCAAGSVRSMPGKRKGGVP